MNSPIRMSCHLSWRHGQSLDTIDLSSFSKYDLQKPPNKSLLENNVLPLLASNWSKW